jgi:hypothetical protein
MAVGRPKSYAVLTTGQYSGTKNVDLIHYTAATIAFVAGTKKITDSANGLAIFKAGDLIPVTGSASNNGVYTVVTGNVAGEIVVAEALADEAAGASVSIAKRESKSNNCVLDNNTGLMWLRDPSNYPAKMGASDGKLLWFEADLGVPGAKADDFEWGADGDPISNSGGGITWEKSTPGTCLAEIDTGVEPASGTRCLRIYRDGTNWPSAYTALPALSNTYTIRFAARRVDGTAWSARYSDGIRNVRCGCSSSNGRLYYYNSAGQYVNITPALTHPVDAWRVIEFRNINFDSGTYDIWFNGARAASCPMLPEGSTADRLTLSASTATGVPGSCWFDDVEIIARATPWITANPTADDGLVLSDAPSKLVTIPTAGDPADAVVIGGLGYPLLEGSLQVDMAIGSRSTASFTVLDLDAAWDFHDGQQVEIYESFASGDLIFSGYIDSVDTQRIGATQSRAHAIELKDQHYLADKRLAAETYEGQTAYAVVADLHAKYLADEGVIMGQIEGDDIAIKEMVVNYARVTEVFDRLAELCDYAWWIDQYKQLYFVARTSVPSPWDYVYTESVGSPQLSRGNSRYRNRQYVKGRAATGAQTEVFTGDGETKSWALGYPLNNVPTVSVNGAPASVGIKGLDSGMAFYWSKGDAIVTSDVAPTTGSVISITYIGQYPAIMLSVDSAAVSERAAVEGSTGLVDDIADESGTTDIEALYQIGAAKLTRYCRQAQQYHYLTEKQGLQPGQVQHIYDELLGIDQDMLIEAVSGSRHGGVWGWEVTCSEGPERGSWAKIFEVLAGQAKLVLDRINVGAGETMTALVRLVDATGWSDDVEVTAYTVLLCGVDLKCGDAAIVT